MGKLNNSNMKWIWLSVLILCISVASTTVAYMGRMDRYLLDDSGAISLMGVKTAANVAQEGKIENSSVEAEKPDSETLKEDGKSEDSQADSSATEQTQVSDNDSQGEVSGEKNPYFVTEDDQQVWTTETEVEIFKVSYENDEQVITVQTDDGDKLIAPGTSHTYTFKLKNTGKEALDYRVEVDAYFTPEDVILPVSSRMNRYDETWFVGNADEFASIDVLNAMEDEETLGGGKYTYYTLEWQWPYEWGNDEYDTMLGNMAVEQDLTFTVKIRTMATMSDNIYIDNGITLPQTGDSMNLMLMVVVAAGSFVLLLILLLLQYKNRKSAEV